MTFQSGSGSTFYGDGGEMFEKVTRARVSLNLAGHLCPFALLTGWLREDILFDGSVVVEKSRWYCLGLRAPLISFVKVKSEEDPENCMQGVSIRHGLSEHATTHRMRARGPSSSIDRFELEGSRPASR